MKKRSKSSERVFIYLSSILSLLLQPTIDKWMPPCSAFWNFVTELKQSADHNEYNFRPIISRLFCLYSPPWVMGNG